jgi:hypothetical protein
VAGEVSVDAAGERRGRAAISDAPYAATYASEIDIDARLKAALEAVRDDTHDAAAADS